MIIWKGFTNKSLNNERCEWLWARLAVTRCCQGTDQRAGFSPEIKLLVHYHIIWIDYSLNPSFDHLSRIFTGAFEETDLPSTAAFVLGHCQAKVKEGKCKGGFSKYPGIYPDILHSFYSVCWLSMMANSNTYPRPDPDPLHGLKSLDVRLVMCVDRSPLTATPQSFWCQGRHTPDRPRSIEQWKRMNLLFRCSDQQAYITVLSVRVTYEVFLLLDCSNVVACSKEQNTAGKSVPLHIIYLDVSHTSYLNMLI